MHARTTYEVMPHACTHYCARWFGQPSPVADRLGRHLPGQCHSQHSTSRVVGGVGACICATSWAQYQDLSTGRMDDDSAFKAASGAYGLACHNVSVASTHACTHSVAKMQHATHGCILTHARACMACLSHAATVLHVHACW